GLFAIGYLGFGLSVFVVISTLVLGCFIGEKFFKLDKQTSFLTAIGAAICGAAAVLAAETTSRAKSHQAAIAVATVVLFGTLSMLLYPILYHAGILFLTPWQYGFFTGGSIHEVAQVLAAGEAAGDASAEIAVIVKMTRVILLAPILIITGIYFNRINKASSRLPIYIPWFVIGFIFCIGLNSIKVIPPHLTSYIQTFDLFLLTTAMCALGLNTQFKALASLGLKPFYLGGILWLWLMLSTFTVVILFV
ncbi:MAG: putative sulfate exporter family transporter, partial [Gammaproteobacteria bacterium]